MLIAGKWEERRRSRRRNSSRRSRSRRRRRRKSKEKQGDAKDEEEEKEAQEEEEQQHRSASEAELKSTRFLPLQCAPSNSVTSLSSTSLYHDFISVYFGTSRFKLVAEPFNANAQRVAHFNVFHHWVVIAAL